MAISRLYNFQAGTKINSGQVNAEVNQLVNTANSHDTRIGSVEQNKVPYTGATKDFDVNGKAIKNAGSLGTIDTSGDGYYFQWNEDSNGNYALKSRQVLDDSVFGTLFAMTKEGRLNILHQPFVHATLSSSQAIGSGVATRINLLSNELDDVQGEFSASRYTAVEPGIYLFRGYADFTGSVPTGETTLYLYKNGSVWGAIANETAPRLIQGMSLIRLNAWDYIDLYVTQNSGGTTKTIAGSTFMCLKLS